MNSQIIQANYLDARHASDIALLLGSYAMDPMGGGEPLSQAVLDNLVPALAKLPHAFSVLAYVDDQPAGLVNCFEGFSTFYCKPLINIHDMVVLKEFRGRGLSQALLGKVEQIAVAKGCCKLTLEVLAGNARAKAAYDRFGFAAYELDPELGAAFFWQKILPKT
jgi:GNAT superfamily N-acetyltransferase